MNSGKILLEGLEVHMSIYDPEILLKLLIWTIKLAISFDFRNQGIVCTSDDAKI